MQYEATPCEGADPSDKATAYADLDLQVALANHRNKDVAIPEPKRGAVCVWCLDNAPAQDSAFCCPECRTEWRTDAEQKLARQRRTFRN